MKASSGDALDPGHKARAGIMLLLCQATLDGVRHTGSKSKVVTAQGTRGRPRGLQPQTCSYKVGAPFAVQNTLDQYFANKHSSPYTSLLVLVLVLVLVNGFDPPAGII